MDGYNAVHKGNCVNLYTARLWILVGEIKPQWSDVHVNKTETAIKKIDVNFLFKKVDLHHITTPNTETEMGSRDKCVIFF